MVNLGETPSSPITRHTIYDIYGISTYKTRVVLGLHVVPLSGPTGSLKGSPPNLGFTWPQCSDGDFDGDECLGLYNFRKEISPTQQPPSIHRIYIYINTLRLC